MKQVQKAVIRVDIQRITSNKCFIWNSNLLSLSPILHKEGLLRVGGCLCHANLTQDEIHTNLLLKNYLVTS